MWNCHRVLDNAVASVLSQWYDGKIINYELIFIDDNSTDRVTAKKLSSYDRRLKYGQDITNVSTILLTHLNNKGAASARNSGLRVATGKYICYLDSDDVFYPTRIHDALYKMETENTDVCLSSIDYLGWDRFEERNFPLQTGINGKSVLGIMHTREIYNKLEEAFPAGLIEHEVEVFLNRLRNVGAKCSFTEKVCGKCTIGPYSQSMTKRMPGNGLGITYNQFINNELPRGSL
jgi:glycosyltransferase involved in cell wall biosynthesis